MDKFGHKPFNVVVSTYFSGPVHVSKFTVIGQTLEVAEPIFTVEIPKPHFLPSKEWAETAENLHSSEEESFQNLHADADQYTQNFHTGSQSECLRKNPVSLLSDFTSTRDGSLGRTTTVKHHTDLKPDFRLAVRHPYWVGLKRREHENKEIHRLFEESVTEPAMLK